MNEKIKKLAEQAGFYFDEYNQPTQRKIELLTESIIRDCVNEIHVADVGDLKGKGYYLDRVAEHIEKYFGINK